MDSVLVWTALVTPFNEAGTGIDYVSYERLIRMQEEAGNGIVVLGSTGEALSLSEEEKFELLDFVYGLELKVPVMVGISGVRYQESLDFIKACQKYPVACYLFMTPAYSKPGVMGQYGWFSGLLDAAKKPCMIYNNPSRAAVAIHPQVVKKLEGHQYAWAIKESGGTLEYYEDYRAANAKIKIYCGEDVMITDCLEYEPRGLVSVAANVWPKEVQAYTRACIEGGEKPMIDERWWDLCDSLYVATNPIPTKCKLHELGVIEHATVRLPLSLEDMPKVKEVQNEKEAVGV